MLVGLGYRIDAWTDSINAELESGVYITVWPDAGWGAHSYLGHVRTSGESDYSLSDAGLWAKVSAAVP